jgi:lysophospholipase L1-like esterase
LTNSSGPTSRRRLAFLAITLLAPWILLAMIEIGLRVAWRGGRMAVFDPVTIEGRPFLVPGRSFSHRYFPREDMPPVPPVDVFSAVKPPHTFRIFVLGESSAAGFPYPHNGTFSRVLRDALHDVLPEDGVEVVNLGIAATNSYTMLDVSDDVIAQRPDAVLIYAGHNEYYGALGVGSSIHVGSSPVLVHAYLAAERSRTFVLLQRAVTAAMGATNSTSRGNPATASLMEWVARDQEIRLDSPEFNDGIDQFRRNVGALLQRMRSAHIPVFIASISSNVRDQPPFASPANAPARASFAAAITALARGDSVAARALFERARDLDVIRFRAPTTLNETIHRLSDSLGAVYVPVAERFAALSPAGAPGHELFLEHVHPNQHGYAVIASTFFDAIRARGLLGPRARPERLASWGQYEARMEISAFDRRIVDHLVRTVTTRWPFVARELAEDYRGTYRPVNADDSLALLVSRGGMSWTEAKLRVAAERERLGRPDEALVEYRGILRDTPFLELPNRLVARSLVAMGRPADATPYLEQARRIEPTAEGSYLLGVIALHARQFDRAIALLDEATRMAPTSAASLYQLSLAFGLSRNLAAARATASRALQIDPRYPGLAAWVDALGMRPR